MLKTQIAAKALFCSILFGLMATITLADATEEKVALVIGNAAYQHVPSLDNPANDARDIAAALKRLDFDVTLLIDQSDTQLRQAIRAFAKDARAADLSIVYYAGHGIEIDKVNYLIPVNAELLGDSDADFEAIRLSDMLRAVSGGDGVSLMLVDACRDNPFASSLRASGTTRSIGNGLVRVNPRGGVLPGGVLVSYAAREGEFALDGEGRNSPYATGLLEHLEEPGLEVSKFFRKVRDTVFAKTGGLQEPFTYGSLPGRDIYLAAAPPIEPQTAALPSQQHSDLPEDFLKEYAQAQKLDTLYLYRRFLETYGSIEGNALVDAAKTRVDELSAEAAKRKAEKSREPWLTPEVGLRSFGAIELSRDEVRLVQRSLELMGMDTGGVDGQMGPKTRSAIFNSRIKFGLPANEQIDAAFLRRIPNPKVVEDLSSEYAVPYKAEDLPEFLEPRLDKALRALEGNHVRFGYFRGRLYLAILLQGRTSWSEANLRAKAAGGYIATIGSAAENDFLFRLYSTDRRFLLKDSKGYWHGPSFGLYQRKGSAEPRGGWTWVTGEPVRYTNWSPGNPDNHNGRQDYASFFVRNLSDREGTNVRFWDDNSFPSTGYFIEID